MPPSLERVDQTRARFGLESDFEASSFLSDGALVGGLQS